jgi:hypothetical protein
MSPFESQYPQQTGQEKFLDPPRWWIEEIYHKGGVHLDDWIEKKKQREHFVYSISGSLDSGFSGYLRKGDVYADASKDSYFANRDEAYNHAQGQFQGTLSGMNAAAFKYQILKRNRDALVQAKEASARFQGIADELFNKATD